MKAKSQGSAIILGTSFLKKVDEWRRKQRDRPSRAVAIRRLAERGGLAGSTSLPRKGGARKAAEMADREIEGLGDLAVNRNAHGESGGSSKARENSVICAAVCQRPKVDAKRVSNDRLGSPESRQR
jgi:hypothetical protein